MRFHGLVGYGETVETSPGVYEDAITEREHYGDVTRAAQTARAGEDINPVFSLGNSIEIVADAYATAHISTIRYVVWAGVRWIVTDVEIRPPRLVLRLGEVYRGPTPPTP